MRKYVIGFFCGAIFASTTAVYASDAIKATLFPVQYEINGVKSEPKQGYSTLNYEGRAYVPIRYVAESLDTVVYYSEANKTIHIDDKFNLKSVNSDIRAGHIQVVKEGKKHKITGKLYVGQAYWDELYNSKMNVPPGVEVEISAQVAFYDENAKAITKIPITVQCVAKGDQLKEFEAITDQDLSAYTYTSLEFVGPEPVRVFLPPSVGDTDPSGVLAIGITNMIKNGDYTKLKMNYGVRKKDVLSFEAILTFFDAKGSVLGVADMTVKADKSFSDLYGIYLYETIGKGDLTHFASYTVSIASIEYDHKK